MLQTASLRYHTCSRAPPPGLPAPPVAARFLLGAVVRQVRGARQREPALGVELNFRPAANQHPAGALQH